ncbi:hypothetical protein AG1IA_04324 [Rhizoctonia solani AG-1 IA]|uniref:Uncharacterized protein n=1 Tax=Thanatephorus cucumeris (strain AG1-IA) TaxID=983506 RepID=L8WY12_THACA|nr:hypothetical protein AG1IA_04324 [Rhizoctonia solani AG-1 IA]
MRSSMYPDEGYTSRTAGTRTAGSRGLTRWKRNSYRQARLERSWQK